jgi:hypothetical protein
MLLGRDGRSLGMRRQKLGVKAAANEMAGSNLVKPGHDDLRLSTQSESARV